MISKDNKMKFLEKLVEHTITKHKDISNFAFAIGQAFYECFEEQPKSYPTDTFAEVVKKAYECAELSVIDPSRAISQAVKRIKEQSAE